MAIERKISRQEFLKFGTKLGLGATAFVSGCALSPPEAAESPSPTPPTLSAAQKLATAQVEATQEAKSRTSSIPTPKALPRIEPSPSAKTKEQLTTGLQWQSEIKLPSKTGWFGRTPDSFFTSETSVFVADKEGRPTRLSQTKGEVIWRWEDEANIWGMDSGTIYVMRPDMRFFALDKETGKTKWSVIFPKETNSFVEWPLAITNPAVHLTTSFRYMTTTHTVITIDKLTGKVLWQGDEMIVRNTDKTLIVSSGDGLNPIDGSRKWTVEGEPAAIRDNILIYLVSNDERNRGIKNLAALNVDSGRKLWEGKEGIKNLINTSERYLYVTNNNDVLLALNLLTGAVVKEIPQFDPYKGDFAGEIQNIAVVSFESTGLTRLINLSTGKEVVNSDLRINRILGMWQDTLVALYYDLNIRRPRYVYGIDVKTAQRKYRLTLPEDTGNILFTQDKIIIGIRTGFTVYSAKDMSLIADYSKTPQQGNVISRTVYNDILFIITSNFSNVTTALSAFKI